LDRFLRERQPRAAGKMTAKFAVRFGVGWRMIRLTTRGGHHRELCDFAEDPKAEGISGTVRLL